jgi:hypothetical protein
VAVTGHDARLGTWLLAKLYQGRHLRRLDIMRLQGATPSKPRMSDQFNMKSGFNSAPNNQPERKSEEKPEAEI